MFLLCLLVDFMCGELDVFCKVMGKKLCDKLDYMKFKFVEGGRKNGYDLKVFEKIWVDWEKFVLYVFNKLYVICYFWVVY